MNLFYDLPQVEYNNDLLDTFIESDNFYFTDNEAQVKDFAFDTLIFVETGKLTIKNLDTSMTVNNKKIVLIKKGTYIIQFCAEENNIKGKYIFYEKDFFSSFVQKYNDFLLDIIKQKKLQNSEYKEAMILLDASTLSTNIINNFFLIDKMNYHKTIYALMKEELLLVFLSTRKDRLLIDFLYHEINPNFSKLKQFMFKFYLKDWTLIQFAREYGASLTAFKELFQKVYHVSPGAWIKENKLLYAHRLLMSTSIRIVDIAVYAGFSSQSYFTQSYKNRFGKTPSQTRNTFKTN